MRESAKVIDQATDRVTRWAITGFQNSIVSIRRIARLGYDVPILDRIKWFRWGCLRWAAKLVAVPYFIEVLVHDKVTGGIFETPLM